MGGSVPFVTSERYTPLGTFVTDGFVIMLCWSLMKAVSIPLVEEACEHVATDNFTVYFDFAAK